MNRSQCEANLKRLRDELREYATVEGITATPEQIAKAQSLAQKLFLAHSTAEKNAVAICKSDSLLSPAEISKLTGPIKPDSAEAIMGTTGFVFLYAGPFRYPATGCGWLFTPGLEEDYLPSGVANPFDSGGLVHKIERVDSSEPCQDYLARHELPLPEHRDYLGDCLEILFARPEDYLAEVDPVRAGTLGLSGGDCRRWTHEVRMPARVHLRSSKLQAFFVARRSLADPDIRNMVRWCKLQGIDYDVFQSPHGDDFDALRTKCIDYMNQNLL